MMTLSGQPRDLMKGLKQKSQMVTEGHTEITPQFDSQSGEALHIIAFNQSVQITPF